MFKECRCHKTEKLLIPYDLFPSLLCLMGGMLIKKGWEKRNKTTDMFNFGETLGNNRLVVETRFSISRIKSVSGT